MGFRLRNTTGIGSGAAALLVVVAAGAAPAQQLPVPCVAGVCGPSAPTFVTSGAGTAVQSGNALTVTQTTDSAIFNWQSFNIGEGGRVDFSQPSASSVALNRILDSAPSRIFGVLNANGRVYLLNRNGIVFGNGAQVNVGGLVASSLDVTPEALEQGIARAARAGAPAFRGFRDSNGDLLPSGAVRVLEGARIAADGGQVLLLGPEVSNEGTIRTPDGQTIMAAGQEIYLTSSSDPNLVGLLVEVSLGGTVTNGRRSNATAASAENLVGQISAERGNVSLVGLAVNQLGRISATTSVRSNGSVRLLARDGASVSGGAAPTLLTNNGGDLRLGERSVTAITLDTNPQDRTVDVNEQPLSSILLEGRQIRIERDARLTARGGTITAIARVNPGIAPGAFSASADDSRVLLESGARLDVAGATLDLPMKRNLLTIELRGTQLADSPVQRDGPLRCTADACTPVVVDIRASGTRADGSSWQGTPIADVSGDISTIARTVEERTLNGGSVSLQSSGDVIVAGAATIDVSGGSIRYRDGSIATTRLLGEDGRVYDIGAADPARRYAGIADVARVDFVKWGVSNTYSGFAGEARSSFESGYFEGRDAGAVNIFAPRFIFDGNLIGSTTAGRYQRLPSQPLAANTPRPYNQLPLGAALVLGNAQPITGGGVAPNYLLGAVTFGGGAVLPALLNESGGTFDPRQDLWPTALSVSVLRSEILGTGAAARTSIFANGRIDLPGSMVLTLPGAGSLSLTASSLQVAGSIDAPGGRLNFVTRPTITAEVSDGLVLAPGSRLTARGRWVNDDPRLGSADAPLLINGGSVSLSSEQAGLRLSPASLIDVSGGAWQRTNGSIVAGRGGSVLISAAPTSTGGAVPLLLGSELRGFALSQGASLAVEANQICIAATDCASDPSTLWLTPARLNAGGFGDIRLASNLRGLEVLPGTLLALRQTNLEFTRAPVLIRTGTELASLTQATVLAALDRRPVNLALGVRVSSGAGPLSAASFSTAPELRIATGTAIDLDPLATLALTSNSRVVIDGSISAPAGNVSIGLGNDLLIADFLPSQGIWLASNARIDVRGLARVVTDDLGRRTGDVLDGGTVSITASRGYIVSLPGSLIDVSGAAAELDILESLGGSGRTVARTIESRGGGFALQAAEGMLLNGLWAARGGGATGTSAGGSLSLRLDAGSRNDPGQLQAVLPIGPRRAVLTDATSLAIVAPGTSVPTALNGQALLSASAVESAGFDFLDVAVRSLDILSGGQIATGAGPGQIVLRGDLDLNIRGRISLDAAELRAEGGTARIASSVVSVGHSDAERQSNASEPQGGSGQLFVDAGLLQLIGSSRLSGFERVDLSGRSEIQLRGVQSQNDPLPIGTFSLVGDLRMASRQIVPSTLTDFTIATRSAAQSDPAATIRIDALDGERSTVLSAAGRLTLSAPVIEQFGVLRAPFGSIALNATRLELGAGSLTSTTAVDELIPFGTTQGGFDWTFGLPRRTVVFGVGATDVPQQSVSLNADAVEFRAGAIVDVRGGGDLLAYEFIPGTTGTIDVLDSRERPNQFAVVPSLRLDYAPFDPSASAFSALRPGDSVYLGSGSGLAAGFYTLLPARYALLPDAFLVSEVAGFRDLPDGAAVSLLDGSRVVAGFRTLAGTAIRDPRSTGFAVRAGVSAQQEARYSLTRASDFFAAQYDRFELPRPRLGADAGLLAIAARTSLDLDGQLRAAAAAGGRGAAFDLSSDRLQVVSSASTSPQPGFVSVLDQRINALQAESMLLGGTTSPSAAGTRLVIGASRVSIGAGALLEAPEILLVAREQVEVGNDAVLRATGSVLTSTDALLIEGDGALLRVSRADAGIVSRSAAAGTTGSIDIAPGARLEAGDGSITLEASRDARSAGVLATTGTLSLGAARISLGDTSGVTEGLQLSSADLAALDLRGLRLRSATAIDVAGEFAVNAQRVSIDAGGFRARPVAGGTMLGGQFNATSVRLANLAGVPLSSAPASEGSLRIFADEIVLGDGAFAFAGIGDTQLDSAADLYVEGDGALRADGRLQVAARRIAAASGATYGFSSGAELSLLGSDRPPTAMLVEREAGLGARFDLLGRQLSLDTLIAAPAGVVTARAIGPDLALPGAAAARSLELGSQARIDVSGRTLTFDGVDLAAPGGRVLLVAQSGGVAVRSGSIVNVGGSPGGGDAGRIEISAPQGAIELLGELRGSASSGSRAGEAVIDGLDLGSFSALNRALSAGGFSALRDIRLRGAGDLRVGATPAEAINASRIRLTADRGSIFIDGQLGASGLIGGEVILSALQSVVVTGRIDAAATAQDGRGGRVELLAGVGGTVRVADGAQVDVSAGAGSGGVESARGGRVLVRVDRDGAQTLLDSIQSNDRVRLPPSSLVGAARVDLEGYAVYSDADGVLTAAETSTTSLAYQEALAFMGSAESIRAALGWAVDGPLTVRPGVEIRASNDLRLAANWNLFDWRFSGIAGVLTLRAPGNLRFDASLSDGFAALTGPAGFALADVGDSWSYRLIGGADLASSDPLAVRPLHLLASGSGNVAVAGGTPSFGSGVPTPRMIRTGTGDIDIVAGRDFELGNRASVVYTAGRASVGVGLTGTGNLGGRAYPVDGGDLRISAQQDVRGAQTNQLLTDWLWRTGRVAGSLNPSATGWTINFQEFEQNVGALGGGDLLVRAGRDIQTLSAVAPSIGRQVGGRLADQNLVEVLGTGALDVSAGGNILGGVYYVGGGAGRIRAGGVLGADAGAFGASGLNPILAVDSGRFDLSARTNLTIEAIVNPFLLPQGASQIGSTPNVRNQSYFSTYGADASVRATSVGGDLTLLSNASVFGPLVARFRDTMFFQQISNVSTALRLAPPRVSAAALSGNLALAAPITLYPSLRGTLELYARNDLRIGTVETGSIIVSDADPALLPGIDNPAGSFALVFDLLGTALTLDTRFNAANPLARQQRAAPGFTPIEPIRLVAQEGSILHRPQQPADTSLLYFSRPARLIAGDDIRDLGITVQHVFGTDQTTIAAGRDLIYSIGREANGTISPNLRAIAVDGPGRLDVVAGRNIDLQASVGITTRGNLRNPALADRGADVSLLAGVGDGQQNAAGFVDRYLTQSLDLLARLRDFVTGVVAGAAPTSSGEALALFQSLSEDQRRGFLAEIFPARGASAPDSRRIAEGASVDQQQQYLSVLADYESRLVEFVNSLIVDRAVAATLAASPLGALALFSDRGSVSDSRQSALLQEILFSELRFAGRIAAQAGEAAGDAGPAFTALETLYPGSNPDPDAGEQNRFAGDIRLFFSRVYTLDGGGIELLAPGGGINVGLASPPAAFGIAKRPDQLGIVAQSTGSVQALAFGDFEVNESRVFAADGGNILVWSTRGDIDAGRGAKTAISAPPPLITFDDNGFPVVIFPAALTGSGIQTLATTPGRVAGDVDLFAPRGIVNAGDAGIVCQNCTIFATAVIGANNIQVGGVSVGVPVDTGGLAAGLTGVSNVATSASAAAAAVSQDAGARQPSGSPLADSAIGWLEVFIEGFGDDVCKPNDEECLRRARERQ